MQVWCVVYHLKTGQSKRSRGADGSAGWFVNGAAPALDWMPMSVVGGLF